MVIMLSRVDSTATRARILSWPKNSEDARSTYPALSQLVLPALVELRKFVPEGFSIVAIS